MTDKIIFIVFLLGVFISMVMYIVRFLKTPNLFKTLFKKYLSFLERDTFPIEEKRGNIKTKKSKNWQISEKDSCLEYEKFKEKFPDEEYPYI